MTNERGAPERVWLIDIGIRSSPSAKLSKEEADGFIAKMGGCTLYGEYARVADLDALKDDKARLIARHDALIDRGNKLQAELATVKLDLDEEKFDVEVWKNTDEVSQEQIAKLTADLHTAQTALAQSQCSVEHMTRLALDAQEERDALRASVNDLFAECFGASGDPSLKLPARQAYEHIALKLKAAINPQPTKGVEG